MDYERGMWYKCREECALQRAMDRKSVAEQQIGCRSNTQLLAGSCCRDRSPETLLCTPPSSRRRLRAQIQPLRGGTHLSFIYSDNCDWVFFLFWYSRSKLLEVPECSSCSHAACEQPTPSATALPFPLKLGGKHVTAITCLCILLDLLLQLKFFLVREAFDRTFASQRFSSWSWAGSVLVAKHSALQLKLEIQGFNLFVKQQVQQMKLYILLIHSLLVWKKSMILITQFIAWVTSLDFRRIHN